MYITYIKIWIGMASTQQNWIAFEVGTNHFFLKVENLNAIVAASYEEAISSMDRQIQGLTISRSFQVQWNKWHTASSQV